MRRIANKHLAKLWDFMTSYNLKSAGAPAGDIVIAVFEKFLECDEALSELQDERDHWKTMYGNACGDQDVLKESIRLLDTENRRLRQQVSDQEKEINQRRKEYESLQGLNRDIIAKHNEDMRQLREENEDLKKQNEAQRHVIDDFVDTVSGKDNELQDLQKENEELKKDCAYMTNSRDTWRSRAKHAEAEVEELKKKLDVEQHAYNGACKDRDRKAEAVVELAKIRDQLQEALDNIRAELEAKVKRMDEITKERDSYHDLYTELKKDYDRLVEENKWLKARTNCLREEVQWHRKHYKEQSDKIRDLKSRLNSIYGTELPGVKEEYTMTFAMDRENFDKLMAVIKEGMGNSKSVGDMRDFLKTFCEDHDSCRLCPLKECGSDLGRGFDSMSDEEIEKYYKIAIDDQSEREKPDLKFGDIVKVPWSKGDYIFIETLTSSIRLYSITKRRFVIVAKNEHLKWVGHIKK